MIPHLYHRQLREFLKGTEVVLCGGERKGPTKGRPQSRIPCATPSWSGPASVAGEHHPLRRWGVLPEDDCTTVNQLGRTVVKRVAFIALTTLVPSEQRIAIAGRYQCLR